MKHHKVTHAEFGQHIARFKDLDIRHYVGQFGVDVTFYVKRGSGFQKVAAIYLKEDGNGSTSFVVYK